MGYTLNRVDLIGNLGKDPEVRNFPNGGRVTSLSIATSERWKDKHSGEVREKTEWHRVEVKNDFLAEIAGRLRKGMTVCVSGRSKPGNGRINPGPIGSQPRSWSRATTARSTSRTSATWETRAAARARPPARVAGRAAGPGAAPTLTTKSRSDRRR